MASWWPARCVPRRQPAPFGPSRVGRLVPLLMILVLVVACARADVVSPSADSPAKWQTIGYVTYWDQERGFRGAYQHVDGLTGISPWWYAPLPSGEVVAQDFDATRIDLAAAASFRARGVAVMPTLANHRGGAWDHDVVGVILADLGRTETHIGEIVDMVVTQGYDGVDLDYENMRSSDRTAFSRFVDRLAARLHDHGKLLAVDVHPKTTELGVDDRNAAQDYAAIGRAADQVRLMAYDFHWSGSSPGPIAPVGWFGEVVGWAASQVPKGKLIVGLPLFGYDWTERGGEPITWEQARMRAAEHRANISYDPISEASSFVYADAAGSHTVWFENARSISTKIDRARSHGVGGVFLWRVGGEDPKVWSLLNAGQR